MTTRRAARRVVLASCAVGGVLLASAIVLSVFATAVWAPEARPSGLQTAVLARASVIVTWGDYLDFGGDPGAARWQVLSGTPSTYRWHWGVLYRHASVGNTSQFILPLWMPMAVVVAAGAWACRRRLVGAARARRGACMGCGHSRAGLGLAAACPECGTGG